MFKKKDEPLVSARVESTHTFDCDLPIEQVWFRITDPAFPPGDREEEVGWLPGHRLGVGAISYVVNRQRDGRLSGYMLRVSVCDAPSRLVMERLKTESVNIDSSFEWNLRELSDGVSVSLTLRMHSLKLLPLDAAASLERAVQDGARRLADEVSTALGARD